MNVLYVERGYLVRNPLQHLYHRLKRWLAYRDQDGFFEESLDLAATVTRTSLSKTQQRLDTGTYNWLLVNWKQPGFESEAARADAICELFAVAQKKGLRTALFINAAQAQYLPPESVLDGAEVVFKREPWRDRSRYTLSEANQTKLVSTMIHCPLVPSPRSHFFARCFAILQRRAAGCDCTESQYDVGFSGADAAEHSLRRDVWQRVVDEGFSRLGGLQPNPKTKTPIAETLIGPRFMGRAYRNALCASKVNLALKGIGEYTFRHQELFSLGAFVLSDDSILASELPMPLEEGKHYVAFDTLDEMVEKICYYLEHEDERLLIAAAGKKLFDEYYDPARHAETITQALQ